MPDEILENILEGPLYFFRDAWKAIFALREAWMKIYFFRDSWIYIFPSSGNCFRCFRDPWNMYLSRDLWTNDFFGNNFSLFWRILSNYTKLDAKPIRCSCTNHRNVNSEPGGPRICNHDQESWDKFALSAFLSTRQTWIQLDLPNLATIPNTMLKTTSNFFWF